MNKKGFTLVELLAVIIILAVLTGIAVISISNVITSARNKSYVETALTIINGVRKRVVLANEQKEGTYYFDDTILESGGKKTPYGGDIIIGNPETGGGVAVSGADGIYWKAGVATCSATANSFVAVYKENDIYKYRICLTAGANEKYINGTEDTLSTDDDDAAIFDDSSSS